MKLAVIYDSKTNNTAAVAGYMAEAMNSLEGVEAKTFLYSEVDTEFVKECKGVVFGCPTYAAGPTSDFYTWMEKNAGGLNLAGKLGGVFATEQYIHGGADYERAAHPPVSIWNDDLFRRSFLWQTSDPHGTGRSQPKERRFQRTV